MLPEHTRSVKFFCRVDPSAVASILIALLWLFMTEHITHVHGGVPVLLSPASHSVPLAGAEREDALTVAITRDGKVFLNLDQINPNALTGKIEEHLQGGAEKTVYIKADARVHYREVAQVLNCLREAKIEKVGLLTQQRRPGFS